MNSRQLLTPFSWLYGVAANYDRQRKLAERYRSSLPVISIGNLSTGGSGKTPLAIHLAKALQSRLPLFILSRGYGRTDRRDLVWMSGDPPPDPLSFGDEPTLIARSISNGGVAVGADRAALLRRLEPEIPGSVILLDDGFQHHRLARDLDIVIVDDATAELPWLLPAGGLRERPEALGRAQVLLATSDQAEEFARRHAGPDAEIFRMTFESTEPVGWIDGAPYDREEPAILLTGIAHPERIDAVLDAMEITVRSKLAFRDHQAYLPREISDIKTELDRMGVRRIITTAKDAVKLQWHTDLAPILSVIGLNVVISDAERLMARVWSAITTNSKTT